MIVSEGKTAQSARAWGWKGVGGEGKLEIEATCPRVFEREPRGL